MKQTDMAFPLCTHLKYFVQAMLNNPKIVGVSLGQHGKHFPACCAKQVRVGQCTLWRKWTCMFFYARILRLVSSEITTLHEITSQKTVIIPDTLLISVG
jgi:hypothetical protein